MASLRIQIDLGSDDRKAAMEDVARELGWETLPGSSGADAPDILVTEISRLSGHPYLREDLLNCTQVFIAARKRDLSPDEMFGIRVFGVIEPDMGPTTVKEVLMDAARASLTLREERSMWRQLEKRYSEASVLLDLALELVPELTVEEVLQKIIDHIADDLGYAIVSIMLLEEDGIHLAIKAAKGLSRKIVETSRMEVGKGVSGTVARTGQPLLVKDVEADARFDMNRSHNRYTTKSLISVPLKVGDRIIGVLNANNKSQTGALNEYDLHILSVFASHVSVSIERAKLYNSLETKAQELARAYEKLKDIDQMKSDFIINVSHEYRTPVTIILGYLELLKNTLVDPAHLEKVNVTFEAAGRLSNLIDDSTDLLRLNTGSAPFRLQETQLHYFLEEAVRGQWPRFGLKGVELSLDLPESLPDVRADQDKIRKVFEKLLDNALKFTPTGGYVKVGAQAYGEGGVLIWVEDSGPGVSPEDAVRIFDHFEQGGDIMTEKPEGTGLGLPIAKAIVARHRGTIGIDGQYRNGCRILVTLPSVGSWGKT